MPPVDDDDDFFTLPASSRPRAPPPRARASVDDDDDAFDLMPPLRTPAILREEDAAAFRRRPEARAAGACAEALTDLEEGATFATVGDAVSCLVSARVGDEKQAEADAASQSEGDSGVSM